MMQWRFANCNFIYRYLCMGDPPGRPDNSLTFLNFANFYKLYTPSGFTGVY